MRHPTCGSSLILTFSPNHGHPAASPDARDRCAWAAMLAAQQVRGELELVLGLHRDPEVGLLVMAGAGGVLLELIKDVTFCAAPVSRDKARDMLKRTRVARLIEGYGGAAPGQ